jgi:hypothetical protein
MVFLLRRKQAFSIIRRVFGISIYLTKTEFPFRVSDCADNTNLVSAIKIQIRESDAVGITDKK